MIAESLRHTFKRCRTLQTHRVTALPIVILMPHSACNCRCVMCDIWKDNKNLKQLTEADISGLLDSLERFGTRQVVMSGGEALLNANFFKLCAILKKVKIRITLLTTGLTLKKNATQILRWVDDLIVSLDGDQSLHDAIRKIPGAFEKLEEGIRAVRLMDPQYRITARTVIHRLNFRNWEGIIRAAKQIGIDQISFLPADVSSHAFNRQTNWAEAKQNEILIAENELVDLDEIIAAILVNNKVDFTSGFIAESPGKIQEIYQYYAAFYNLNPFPFKKCNAPWVSAVIEADGTVRPCFFHDPIGNIKDGSLSSIVNSNEAIYFRKTLDMSKNATCIKCVCSLNLSPFARLA